MTNPLKRVPKWAWLVAGGVGVGGLALRYVQSKRDATAVEAGTTGTDPATGQPVGTAPPGVIVPPVIMGGGGDSGEGAAALGELAGVLGQGFSDVLATASGLAWTPAEISGLLGTTGQQWTDQVLAVIGAAGMAPQPASQVPTVIVQTQPTTPAGPSVPGHACPSGFNQGTPPNCFKDCGHCEKRSDGKWQRNHGHCYQDGHRVHMGNDVPGGCP